MKDELYKWELINKFRGRPDLKAPDFSLEIKNIDFKNLMYPMAIVVKNHITNDLPAEFRECFVKLFNEDEDLTSRVEGFMENVLTVYRKLEAKLGHHHDERTIASYITYHDPEKYTFFKDSFYQKYCKFIGVGAKQKGVAMIISRAAFIRVSRGIEDCSLWALPFNESNVKRAMRIPMYGLIEQVSFIDIDLKIKN